MDKREALLILLEKAMQKKKDIDEAGKGAQERANEAEGAMVSRYDTFKEEGQYLAGGLKLIGMELTEAVFTLKEALKSNIPDNCEKVSLYSFVTVEYQNGNSESYFITPVMGGEKISEEIITIRPVSPLGKVLMGKEEGDSFILKIDNGASRKEGVIKKGEVVEVF